MTEYILSKLQAVSPEVEGKHHATTLDTSGIAIHHSCIGPSLENLPAEVVHHICTYLPFRSALSLRLTCRNLVPHITMNQAVYRKQLLAGHLFAFTDLDLGLVEQRWDEIKDKDWRRLVRMLTRYENFYAGEHGSGASGKLHDAPIGLKNRMRIIKIVQGIFTGT